jgi:15-cis-phytoene desaturase
VKKLDVVIIGGGLAGLSCAEELIDAGKNIMLLEARQILGGRTASWVQNSMKVESGLHRFLGFYTELPKLLEKAGITLNNIVAWEDEIEIRLPDHQPRAVFGASLFHKPLKTIATVIANNDFIKPRDKVDLLGFFATGLKRLEKEGETLDAVSVKEVAEECGLSEQLIFRMITPLTEGIFFLAPDKHSAYPFFMLIKQLVQKGYKQRIGTFVGGMSEVLINPLALHIESRGGEILTNVAVRSLKQELDNTFQIETEWGVIKVKTVVVACDLGAAQRLLKPWNHIKALQPFFSLPAQPAVTLQVELDQPALESDRTIFAPGTILSSFAEQSRTTFQASPGRLSIILANPEKYIQKSAGWLLKKVLTDLNRLDIQIGTVTDYCKVAHPSDFYRLGVGMEVKRPDQKSPITGLYLAGDYTKQPLMATMEGAVISGKLAAEALLSS